MYYHAKPEYPRLKTLKYAVGKEPVARASTLNLKTHPQGN